MLHSKTLRFILTALFAALICVSTLLVQIPIPATGGYANLGDGVILICAFLLSPAQAILAAGVGSMLADVITGYMLFAPGTLIIKAGVACIASLLFRRFAGKGKGLPVMVFAGLLSECWMVLGYFLYESILLGVGMAAIGGVVGNIGQGAVGVVLSSAVTPLLLRSKVLRDLLK